MYILRELYLAIRAYLVQRYYENPARSQRQIFAASVLALLLAGTTVRALSVWSATPSEKELFEMAIASQDSLTQITSTQALRTDYPASHYLNRLATESSNPDVIALAVSYIGTDRNYSAIETVFSLLSHNSPTVRERASQAISELLGRDYGYPVNASTEVQEKTISEMREDWSTLQGSELYEYNKTRFN